LIKNIEIWNYDDAYWRDFSIIEFNESTGIDHFVDINNNKTYTASQIKKMLYIHNKIIKSTMLITKFANIDNIMLEKVLCKMLL